MVDENSKIIKSFFRYLSTGFFILCIKVNPFKKIDYELVRTLWVTFLYCFIVATWIGLAGMGATIIFVYIKKNYLNEFNPCFYNAQYF